MRRRYSNHKSKVNDWPYERKRRQARLTSELYGPSVENTQGIYSCLYLVLDYFLTIAWRHYGPGSESPTEKENQELFELTCAFVLTLFCFAFNTRAKFVPLLSGSVSSFCWLFTRAKAFAVMSPRRLWTFCAQVTHARLPQHVFSACSSESIFLFIFMDMSIEISHAPADSNKTMQILFSHSNLFDHLSETKNSLRWRTNACCLFSMHWRDTHWTMFDV